MKSLICFALFIILLGCIKSTSNEDSVENISKVFEIRNVSENQTFNTSSNQTKKFKIAFTADQGSNENTKKVLQLIKNEGVDLLIVSGDLDYQNNPIIWGQSLNNSLGSRVQVITSIGNHELDKLSQYLEVIKTKESNIVGFSCEGKPGIKQYCRSEIISILTSSVGFIDQDHAKYISDKFENDTSLWKICSWHSPERHDSNIRKAMDECRKQGAIIMTGHVHSYSRTGLVHDFSVDDMQSFNNQTMQLQRGKSILIVSGLGGAPIRDNKEKILRENIQYYNNCVFDYVDNFGALFCSFGETKAECYFKNIDNKIVDHFNLLN